MSGVNIKSVTFKMGFVDEKGEPIAAGSAWVHTAGANTLATIYSDPDLATAITQPITVGTDGSITFYGPLGTASYDVVVQHSRGRCRMNGVTESIHRGVVDLQQVTKHLKIPFTKKTAEFDTGIDMPVPSEILDAVVEVVTAASGATIDVGLLSTETAGDADGLVDGVSCATAGFYRGQAALDGGAAYFASNTRGVLMSAFVQGTNADDRGLYIEKPHLVQGTNAKSVSYTTSNHTVAGYIHIFYVELGNVA